MSDVEVVQNPFDAVPGASRGVAESAGARAVQARESAEVMALAMMAKRFPRNVIQACDKIRNAFTRQTLAEKAQYQYSRGGSDVVGPSIRAAEAAYFRASWTAFQADRRQDFSVIVDGVSS